MTEEGTSRSGVRRPIGVPNGRRSYLAVVGVVASMLLVGLLVPLVFGDPVEELATAGGASTATPGQVTATTGTAVGGANATTGAIGGGAASSVAPASSAGPGSSAGGQAGGVPPGVTLTASDVGITETTIDVGAILLNVEALQPLGIGLGNWEVENQRRLFQTFIDDLNRRGGVQGRQVRPVFYELNALDTNAYRASCLALTEDHPTFFVMAAADVECITMEHRTPGVGGGTLRERHENSGWYYMSPSMNTERLAANWAAYAVGNGLLEGRTIGIVSSDLPDVRLPADRLEASLGELGHPVAYRARMSSDSATAQSQVPLEVQRMRSAGVDTVFFILDPVTAINWVQQAQGQGWRPQYFTSDVAGLTQNGFMKNMPASFEGATALTQIHQGYYDGELSEPEPETEAACRQLYNQANPDARQFEWGEEGPLPVICSFVQIFERVAAAAGPNLTRESFVAAAQSLGQFPMPMGYGGSYGPGKTDFMDMIRPLRWSYDCRCYRVAGPPVQGQHLQ